MIDTLEVQVTNEHLQKLMSISPLKALAELIWNALDADATDISVTFEKSGFEGIERIERISISDNGHGIQYDSVARDFGHLGNSRKLAESVSPQGRKYHGKQGQGRYSAFVLGKSIEWYSAYKNEDGLLSEFKLTSTAERRTRFDRVLSTESIRDATGVTVIISNPIYEVVDTFLDVTKLTKELSFIFAPYLLAYKGINITVNNQKIDPQNQIKHMSDHSLLVVTEDGQLIDGVLKVVEWKSGKYRNLYLCNIEGVVYEEENSRGKYTGFSHSGYLLSNYIEELSQKNEIDIRDMKPAYVALRDQAYAILRDIYRKIQADEASEEIRKIKKQKIYPYQGEAESVIESAERQVFDICAVKINELLPEFKKTSTESKKFTYRLLKEALQSNPDSLKTILEEVLNLPTEAQDEFAKILGKTSLKSIINTTKLISNRIAFLNGLEQILYGEEYHKKLKERSQLHKVLLGELWLFGEQYTYGYDDITLKNVLKKHLKLLGRNELIEEIDFRNVQGLDDIPDIGLWRQCVYGNEDSYENLVIELKRPKCTISQNEINQIKRYAYAIEESEYFDKEKTKWKFILLGIKLDKYAKKEIEQDGRENGLIYASKNKRVQVWVKEWNQIIQEAKGKHRFLKEKLELEVKDNQEGMAYLYDKYKQFLLD